MRLTSFMSDTQTESDMDRSETPTESDMDMSDTQDEVDMVRV